MQIIDSHYPDVNNTVIQVHRFTTWRQVLSAQIAARNLGRFRHPELQYYNTHLTPHTSYLMQRLPAFSLLDRPLGSTCNTLGLQQTFTPSSARQSQWHSSSTRPHPFIALSQPCVLLCNTVSKSIQQDCLDTHNPGSASVNIRTPVPPPHE